MAAALAARLPAQESNAKLGLIGLGNRAQRHLAAYRELGGVEVAALSDIQADRMRAARNGPAADAAMYVDYRELIADKNVQAVCDRRPQLLARQDRDCGDGGRQGRVDGKTPSR